MSKELVAKLKAKRSKYDHHEDCPMLRHEEGDWDEAVDGEPECGCVLGLVDDAIALLESALRGEAEHTMNDLMVAVAREVNLAATDLRAPGGGVDEVLKNLRRYDFVVRHDNNASGEPECSPEVEQYGKWVCFDELEAALASRLAGCVVVQVADCPDCDNSGSYAFYGREGLERTQCKFCYTVPNSRFNIESMLAAAGGGK